MANKTLEKKPESNSKAGAAVLGGTVLIGGGIAAYFLLKKKGETPPDITKGTVNFSSIPVEATVFLNDSDVEAGHTPLTLELEQGNYTWMMLMDDNPGVFKTGSFVLAPKEVKNIQADFSEEEDLSFEFIQPTYAPVDIYEGTVVTVTCPVKSTSNVAVVVKGVIELHYGSILSGTGDLIKKVDIPQFSIEPDETHNMAAQWTEITAVPGNRRDIIVRIQRVNGAELGSHEFDDAYMVNEPVIPIGEAVSKISVVYSDPVVGTPLTATIRIKNISNQTISPAFRLDLRKDEGVFSTWQEGGVPPNTFSTPGPVAAGQEIIFPIVSINVPADWAGQTNMCAQVVLDGVNGAWDYKNGLIVPGGTPNEAYSNLVGTTNSPVQVGAQVIYSCTFDYTGPAKSVDLYAALGHHTLGVFLEDKVVTKSINVPTCSVPTPVGVIFNIPTAGLDPHDGYYKCYFKVPQLINPPSSGFAGVDITAVATKGYLALTLNPGRATFYIGSQLYSSGHTYELDAGSYSWTCGLAGYISKSGSFTIAVGQTKNLTVTLDPAPTTGTLEVSISPGDAEVSLLTNGGAFIQHLYDGGSYELNPGSYRWTAIKSGYGTKSGTFSITADHTRYLDITLTQNLPVITGYYSGGMIYVTLSNFPAYAYVIVRCMTYSLEMELSSSGSGSGAFSFSGYPSNYVVSATADTGEYASTVVNVP